MADDSLPAGYEPDSYTAQLPDLQGAQQTVVDVRRQRGGAPNDPSLGKFPSLAKKEAFYRNIGPYHAAKRDLQKIRQGSLLITSEEHEEFRELLERQREKDRLKAQRRLEEQRHKEREEIYNSVRELVDYRLVEALHLLQGEEQAAGDYLPHEAQHVQDQDTRRARAELTDEDGQVEVEYVDPTPPPPPVLDETLTFITGKPKYLPAPPSPTVTAAAAAAQRARK